MLVLIYVGDAGPIELPPGRRCHAKAAGFFDENEPEYVIPGTTHDSTVIECYAPEGDRQNNDFFFFSLPASSSGNLNHSPLVSQPKSDLTTEEWRDSTDTVLFGRKFRIEFENS